jgi:hypothetical protein
VTILRPQPPSLFTQSLGTPGKPSFAALKPDSLPPMDGNVRRKDAPRLTSQNSRVLARLRIKPLTVGEAWNEMKIRRLGARIWDLKQHGYRILTTPLDGGECLYTLLSEPATNGGEEVLTA